MTDDEQDATVKRRPGRPRLEVPSAEFVARQQAIIEQAAEVFQRRGFHAGTLGEVADAVDMRRASLYHYVESKEDLLYQVVKQGLQAAVEELEQVQTISDPRARLAALIRHRIFLVAKHRNIFTVILDHRPLVREADEPAIRELEKRYSDLFEATIASALKAGALPTMEPRDALHAILGMTTWVYKWFRPESDDLEMFTDACVRLIVK